MKSEVVTIVKAHVSNCFELDLPPFIVYHNLFHTEEVVSHCEQLSRHYALPERDRLLLLTAAWFHDIGQLYTAPENHEEKSAEMMRRFLAKDCTEAELSAMEAVILATKVSTEPDTLPTCIIRDADTYHFGTKHFFVTDILVRKEMELRTGQTFPDWKQRSLQLLKSHRFYTTYCQEHLEPGKQENIAILEAEL